jgi:hypothetical protein
MADHYISKFYLEGFTAPRDPERPAPYVFVADIDEGRSSRRAPKNVAAKPDSYSVPTADGRVDRSVERFWAAIENKAARALRAVRADEGALPSAAVSDVTALAAVHLGRVPRIRAMAAQVALQSAGLHGGSSDGIRAFEVARDQFSRMRWEWLRTAPGAPFLTGDAPVVAFDASASAPEAHDLASPGIEVTFPLSPTLALRGSWNGEHLATRALDGPEVMAINGRVAAVATRYCFSHSEDLARWALERRPRPLAANA